MWSIAVVHQFIRITVLLVLSIFWGIITTAKIQKKPYHKQRSFAWRLHTKKPDVKKNRWPKKHPEKKQPYKKPEKDFVIRVLLNEADARKKQVITIISESGFVLESPMGSQERYKTERTKLHVLVEKNRMYLQQRDGLFHKIRHNDLALSPINEGTFTVDGKSYQGTVDLRIDQSNNVLMLINKLHLNEYIYSVLRYESLSYWPLEMQKVQAVASRSYALYQMNLRRNLKQNKNDYYDIKNTNFHQVYNGSHNCTHLREAVLSTHNEIIAYNDAIALTMFDICCGGIIPHRMRKKEEEKPYLFRKNKCTFCKKKSNFSWKEIFHVKNFLKRLKSNPRIARRLRSIKEMIGIRVHTKDKAGIVQSLLVAGKRRNTTIPAHELKKSLPSNLKSLSFDVKKQGNKIVMDGTGFGHSIGLCQLGARELVARGWDYKKILRFYYPQTELRRIKDIEKNSLN